MKRTPWWKLPSLWIVALVLATASVTLVSRWATGRSLTITNWERIGASGHRIGSAGAPAEIVVFGTYACGYCAVFEAVLDSVLQSHPGAVAVVMRSYAPVSTKQQVEWHLAAECAADHGVFPEYHSALFRHPEIRNQRMGWLHLARMLDIQDVPRFYGCVASRKYSFKIEEDTRVATDLGVDRTPTWFLNGQRHVGAAPRKFVDSLVATVLAHSQSDGG